MRAVLAALLLVAGCQFDQSASLAGGAPASDGGPTGGSDAPSAGGDAAPVSTLLCADWAPAPSVLDPCMDITVEGDTLTLADSVTYTYDTDAGTFIQLGVSQINHTSTIVGGARVIVTGRFELGTNATLRPVGTRPLVIASWTDINIAGILDVSSTAAGLGAGANVGPCNAAGDGTSETQGGGGGGGGAFQSVGGDGGAGDDGANAGGLKGTEVPTYGLRGGCPGGNGGVGDGNITEVGLGGAGGGAVYLVARSAVTISGVIHAGGQGGGGALNNRAAGGGGGSGGLIGLEAPSVNLQNGAILAANGGGGGGGGNNQASDPGQDGRNASRAATGGDGESSPLGDGGDGGFRTVPDGQVGAQGSRGGGGGGGGVGYIHISTTTLSNDALVVNPAHTTTGFSP